MFPLLFAQILSYQRQISLFRNVQINKLLFIFGRIKVDIFMIEGKKKEQVRRLQQRVIYSDIAYFRLPLDPLVSFRWTKQRANMYI